MTANSNKIAIFIDFLAHDCRLLITILVILIIWLPLSFKKFIERRYTSE